MGRWIKNKTEPQQGSGRGKKTSSPRTDNVLQPQILRPKVTGLFNTFPGEVKCPACGAVTTSQEALARHILRKRDEGHDALKGDAKTKLKG